MRYIIANPQDGMRKAMSSAPQQFMSFDYQTARKRMIFESLTEGVYYVFNNEIGGHIAEFGTGTGFSTRSIALAMASFAELMLTHVKPAHLESVKSAFPDLYLFDSFAGLPAADNAIDAVSPYVVSGRWHEGRFVDLSKADLLALCTKFIEPERISTFEGWFKDTLPSLDAGTKFAMLHLDCDLYSSTYEVLDYLLAHGHVADGALLFFDDWNCNRASPRFGQRKAWAEIVNKYALEHSDAGEYAMLGHKFFVHLSGEND